MNFPQKKGIIIKLYTKTPKKPNSALRKVALVRIKYTNMITRKKEEKDIEAYIPGENNKLGINNVVLIIPKRKKDLPGVKYTIIKGALDYTIA